VFEVLKAFGDGNYRLPTRAKKGREYALQLSSSPGELLTVGRVQELSFTRGRCFGGHNWLVLLRKGTRGMRVKDNGYASQWFGLGQYSPYQTHPSLGRVI